MDDFKAFTHDWDFYSNNEPFWGAVHDLDLEELAVGAGFSRAGVFQTFAPGAAASAGTTGHIEVDPKKVMGSDRGGGLKFYFGATKWRSSRAEAKPVMMAPHREAPMMSRQAQHPMLPEANCDELARQDYVFALKQHVTGALSAASRSHYHDTIKPSLERKNGQAPDWRTIRRTLEQVPHYRMIGSMKRTIQELTWDTTGESIERQLSDLIGTARETGKRGRRLGSLRLDTGLEAPRYLTAVDIHTMPGNYHVDLTEDDVYAGALYDRGVYLFALGGGGPQSENYGRALAAFIAQQFPHLEPRRILEIGCSAGSTALVLADAFPEAEVHAIDVGAPLLRYAHARSELAGKAIHYSQQNAERTDFADGTFDLVVSTGVLHETSGKALPRIIAECHRLLRVGGAMVHGEDPQYAIMDPYDATLHDWGTRYNNEPYMSSMHELDLVQVAVDAGFARDKAFPQIAIDGEGAKGYRDQVYAPRFYFSGATIERRAREASQ